MNESPTNKPGKTDDPPAAPPRIGKSDAARRPAYVPGDDRLRLADGVEGLPQFTD